MRGLSVVEHTLHERVGLWSSLPRDKRTAVRDLISEVHTLCHGSPPDEQLFRGVQNRVLDGSSSPARIEAVSGSMVAYALWVLWSLRYTAPGECPCRLAVERLHVVTGDEQAQRQVLALVTAVADHLGCTHEVTLPFEPSTEDSGTAFGVLPEAGHANH